VLTRMRPKNAKKFQMPKICPVCGRAVVREDGGAIYKCSNQDCYARMYRRIIHFASKKAFNIDKLGIKIIEQFISSGLIKSAVDLFKLEIKDLIPLERFEQKSAENIYNSIQNSKQIPLDRFIYALSISLVGEEMARDLAKQFGSLEKFRVAKFDEINRMYGVAEKTAKEISDWLGNVGHQKFIDDLIKVGVRVKNYHSPVQANKLNEKSFVVTGTLPTLTREDAHKKIIQYGGKVLSSITSKTDYLIAGENPGSKLDKAKKNNVRIINEEEFFGMIS